MTMIKKDGHWVTVAGGQRMWVGTKAQLNAALAAGELEDGTAVMVTDDYHDTSDYVITGNIVPLGEFIPDTNQTSLTRCGNFVTLTVSGNVGYFHDSAGLSHGANSQDPIFQIPEGFRPAGVLRGAASCHIAGVGDGIESAIFSIETSGRATACGSNTPGQIGWIWGTITYFTTDAWPE